MPNLKNNKREKFCREYMGGKNATQAYITAYPYASKDAAIKSSSRLLTYEDVKHRCLELMEATTGLRLQDFLLSLKELRIAEYPVKIRDTIKMYSDNPTRLQAIQTGFKLMGLMQGNAPSVTDARSITFNVNSNDIKGLDTILTRLERIEQRTDRISGKITESGVGG